VEVTDPLEAVDGTMALLLDEATTVTPTLLDDLDPARPTDEATGTGRRAAAATGGGRPAL
jgi:hypothetical protein